MSRQRPPLKEDAILRTYRESIGPLYAYVSRRVGGDVALAEDLVQDTWMRALRAWPVDGLPDEPLAWLTQVAHNVLVSHFRRVRPEPINPAVLDLEAARSEASDPDSAAVVSWGLTRLRRAHASVLELDLSKAEVDLAVIQRQIDQRRGK